MCKSIQLICIACLFTLNIAGSPVAAERFMIDPKLSYPALVQRFYQMKDQRLFWFEAEHGPALRQRLVSILDSAKYMALEKDNYHYGWIRHYLQGSADTSLVFFAEKVYTDAAISICRDIYHGSAIRTMVQYDELSLSCETNDNNYILGGLSAVTSANELEWFIHFLEPFQKDYAILKRELRLMMDTLEIQKVKQLNRSLNLLRWIKHFNLTKFVVVNAGSAVARYYEADTLRLRMKIVVGTPATPTPSFAAHCNAVILYPYWHVPYSIAVKEILPIVKRDPFYLDKRGMQVLNAAGKVVDPHSINWHAYSAKHFPFQFRQSTGCDNALGVMKFNLTDPYSVYMHDTNNKNAFFAGARYFSHGCIRLEKPLELASELLPGKIDTAFLEACYKDQKPVTLDLAHPVPVFVVYMTVEYDDDGVIRYFKDVYRLVR